MWMICWFIVSYRISSTNYQVFVGFVCMPETSCKDAGLKGAA